MSLVLCRVDERLIHGQVVVGWGMKLRPTHYIVIDDELASSQWEQELYSLALPADVPAAFLTVKEGRRALAKVLASEDRTVVLTRSLSAMLGLAQGGGLADMEVNLGGIHAGPERTRLAPYLHLSPDELSTVTAIGAEGAKVFAQDLPGAQRHSIDDLLD